MTNNNSPTQQTKEELMMSILRKKPINKEIEFEEILECMEEFAKQQAITFEIWRRWQERDGNREIYGKTPEELYSLFNQHSIQNK